MKYVYQRSSNGRYPHWFVADETGSMVVNHEVFYRQVYPWLKTHLGPHMMHNGRYRADRQMVRIAMDDDAFAFRMRWC